MLFIYLFIFLSFGVLFRFLCMQKKNLKKKKIKVGTNRSSLLPDTLSLPPREIKLSDC